MVINDKGYEEEEIESWGQRVSEKYDIEFDGQRRPLWDLDVEKEPIVRRPGDQ